MSHGGFHALLRAARRRRASIVLALALPWCAAAATLAWRLSAGSAAATAATAAVAFLLVFVGAAAAGRRVTPRWLQQRLDALHPTLEDSSGLLAADPSGLAPLARLQRERIARRLPTVADSGVRAHWPRTGLAASLAGAGLAIAAMLAWPGDVPVPTPLPGHAGRPPVQAVGAPRLAAWTLEVVPPAYTGLAARQADALDVRVPEGARLTWTLRFAPEPEAVALEFVDGRRIEARQGDGVWRATTAAVRSGLYRIVPRAVQPGSRPPLHRIDVVPDRPPTLRVTAPTANLTLRTPGQRHWALAFEAGDDHGLQPVAEMHLTMTEGSGENIGFREEVRMLRGEGDRRSRRHAHRLDLDALGLSEGDDLIVHFVVRDNRPGRPQSTRSASHILRWPPPEAVADAGMDGVLQEVLPAYFASQRQIIIDAQALIDARARLPDADFAARSDAIAVDQRRLRLRYGQFLGEENEAGPAPPPGLHAAAHDLPPPPILLPTNDAEDEAEAWRELVSGAQAGAGASTDAPGAGGEAGGHDHDHGSGHAETPGATPGGFGHADGVLEEFGHVHDIPEAATLLDPKTRALLRRALGEMWQSELALRQARPDDALPPAHRALALVKEVQQADRIHLARVGTGLPPVDFGRRLGGRRDGVASRRLPVPATERGEDLAATLWRQLADGAAGGDGLDLAALQAWLASRAADEGDPLAVIAAADAVQRDPGCDDCRQRLRALLWPLAAPPAAAPRPRTQADATGAAYLDALHRGGDE